MSPTAQIAIWYVKAASASNHNYFICAGLFRVAKYALHTPAYGLPQGQPIRRAKPLCPLGIRGFFHFFVYDGLPIVIFFYANGFLFRGILLIPFIRESRNCFNRRLYQFPCIDHLIEGDGRMCAPIDETCIIDGEVE